MLVIMCFIVKLNKNKLTLFLLKNRMSEPKDIKMNKVQPRVRTLSEEYYSRSPDSKAIIKALAQGTSPTSKRRLSLVERLENDIKYLHSDECDRNVMAQYGIVSEEFHNKNKDVKQIHN